jgi:predicted phage terminase large subunit-like protein
MEATATKSEIDIAVDSLDEKSDLLEELQIEAARLCPNAFIEYLGVDDKGNKIKQGRIHIKIQAHLTENTRAQVIVPRKHGKSVQVALYRAAWEVGQNQNHFIKILRQDVKKASQRLQSLMKIIESPKYKKVFPEVEPDYETGWSKTQMYVKRKIISDNPTIEACSVESGGAGGRATIIIVDDACDIKNTILNPAKREHVKTNFYGSYSNQVTDDGVVWYICTPYHQDDLSADVEKNEAYETLRIPIVGHTPIWPEGMNRKQLEEKHVEIKDREYARGYNLRAIADDEIVFHPKYMEQFDIKIDRLPELPAGQKYKCVIGVDPNASEKGMKKGDYFSIATLAYDKANVYVVDMFRGKIGFGEHVPTVMRYIKRAQEKFRIMEIRIEATQYQGKLVSDVSELTRIPVYSVKPTKDKVTRCERGAKLWSVGKLKILTSIDHFVAFIAQLTFFPLVAFDDMVDAVTTAMTGIPDYDDSVVLKNERIRRDRHQDVYEMTIDSDEEDDDYENELNSVYEMT